MRLLVAVLLASCAHQPPAAVERSRAALCVGGQVVASALPSAVPALRDRAPVLPGVSVDACSCGLPEPADVQAQVRLGFTLAGALVPAEGDCEAIAWAEALAAWGAGVVIDGCAVSLPVVPVASCD
jgi:hypothetical protein